MPLPVETGEWDVLETEQICRQNASKITKLMVVATPSGKGKRKTERQADSAVYNTATRGPDDDDDYVRFYSAMVPLTNTQ